ncbi:MAG: DNA translocase FtsK 4TM domain-containing protein [bacterium]
MARKKRKDVDYNDSEKSEKGAFSDLGHSTVQSVWGLLLFLLSIFFIISAFNKAGIVGEKIHEWLGSFFGLGYYLVPLLLLILSMSFFADRERRFPTSKLIGAFIFFVSGLGLFSMISENSGGFLGDLITKPLIPLFDRPVSYVFLVGLIIISLVVIFDTAIRKEYFFFWRLLKKNEEGVDNLDGDVLDAKESSKLDKATEAVKDLSKTKNAETRDSENTEGVKDKNGSIQKDSTKNIVNKGSNGDLKDSPLPNILIRKSVLLGKKWEFPPLELLERDKGKPDVGDIKANANIIKRTLQNFGIDVEMDEVSIGPSVTRYALKPAEGVKLSRILGLQNNLSLALAAHPIRIEAPIPGKSLVGIEIPNSVKTMVRLGSLLGEEEFKNSTKPLYVALGKGISGKSYFDDLAKMPHLLIAGATGSGKSVTIHTVITSLLYRNAPDNLKLIFIDPKRVELTLYNKIPHLLTPVITDAKKAILALRWAAKEMDRRYDILEKSSVRDIASYHKNVLLPELEKIKADENLKVKKGEEDASEYIEAKLPDSMPYIVIVIDELADIMQTYPRELESAIVRLAQMSRAVGIHLILSTQRPSVNVITGLIKANVPSRIALQVASQIDSRTILDMRGAEELLGAGDMLYLSAEMSSPRRIQSAFMSETELKKVVKHLVDHIDSTTEEIQIDNEENGGSAVNDPIFSASAESGVDPEDDDELYQEAKEMVMQIGKASTSYIQRKLRVGYARAARLMDILEERGVIGPADGARPREVIGYGGGDSTGGGSDENSDNSSII